MQWQPVGQRFRTGQFLPVNNKAGRFYRKSGTGSRLWTFLPPDAKSAIIHDWMYDNTRRTKKEADLQNGMTVPGVPKWKRQVMYLAVRVFGRGKYQ
ncbi:TPA: DUF1353 domain-containing protein [Klebsiella oxytoca]|uniref:DUF1353 domain-containing protein n=1 Tax=Klebsiella oxytoca TaxID=571 RepID=A0AAN5LFP6_KLEOX|nr:DUF1353 domain-containing protein [Klebsiella oxytoca]